MKTELKTYTIKELTQGFTYNELEEKGVYGLNGKLVIQPEYQRGYLYAEKGRDKKVIESILHEYPLGLIYFVVGKNEHGEDLLEVLDGQQRITSIGRFVIGRFAVIVDGQEQTFSSLPQDKKDLIMDTELLVYVCEGTETEIKQWFETINTAGIELNDQELRNAVYSGSFITHAKEIFSRSNDVRQQKWGSYVKGDPKRQEVLETALKWIAYHNNTTIDRYLSEHRHDENAEALLVYFETVINWVASRFPGKARPQMRGLDWGYFYEKYKDQPYDVEETKKRLDDLFGDPNVKKKRNIYEFLLEKEQKPQLLDIRFFEESTKQQAYNLQTKQALNDGVSNCPYCVQEGRDNKTKIYDRKHMEADHVTAWSKGGASTLENCQILCIAHNRMKENA